MISFLFPSGSTVPRRCLAPKMAAASEASWELSLSVRYTWKNQLPLTPSVRCCMQTKPEFRKSERFGHQYIIKLGEDPTLSPYYAVSHNLSETGMYFKSLFEMHPEARIRIVINDSIPGPNQVQARVVWCAELKNSNTFRYGVGVEFLHAQTNSGSTASPPIAPRMKSPCKQEGGVVIQLSKRSFGE
jgi:hypothetical protein